jgi:Tol biopolymer transport system component
MMGLKQIGFFILFSLVSTSLLSQSFGKNKMRYRNFDFKVKETEHFDIYYYLNNEKVVDELGQYIEQWYTLHKAVLGDTFATQNPFIVYNNHADFQQTNAISGSIGVGTGGVTEAFKNRVIIPLAMTNQQIHHVIGHELVHAFQYNMILNGDSTSIQSLQNLPLWMVEGLAEYLSIGRTDPHTAMWMRDAVLNEDVPTLRKLSNPEYFPYRYGQAFWSFVTGTFGDEVIAPLFKNTAIFGIDIAIDSTLGMSYKNLSELWVQSINNYYKPYLEGKKESLIGNKLISEDNGGFMNISPSLSPNGRYVIFFSEKDVFTTDLYLADAKSGEIIRKISSQLKDSHLDNYNFLESAGTWSPNSSKFAFVAFDKGQNVLVIKDANSGKTLETIQIDGLRAFSNPAWSPDNRYIVLSGQKEGQTDLFAYDLRRGKLEQLTNDVYSEIHASFSPDGSKLVFSSDKVSIDQGRTNGKWTFNISIMDLESKKVSILNLFPGADNLNPQFDSEGNLYFLSDRDGFRNLYKYEVSTGQVYQETAFLTGISGITAYSPAFSLSPKRDRILYSHYYDKKYTIYQASSGMLMHIPVDSQKTDFSAGTLPVMPKDVVDAVNQNLSNLDRIANADPETFKNKKYRPKFQMDYIGGGAGVGVGNTTFGNYTGLAGGVELLFSDMLGNHQMYTQLAVNGEIYDFGGQFTYMNRQKRFAWGLGISHIPYRTGWSSITYSYPLELNDGQFILTDRISTNLLRIFDETLSAFAHYPFSPNLRLEGGVSGSYRSFRYDEINDYYQAGTYFYIGQEKENLPIEDTIQFSSYFSLIKGFSSSVNIALVGDNSFNGLTSPLKGYRYRLSAEQFFGTDNYTSFLADLRYYYWLRPLSFAVRGMAYTRFDQDVNSVYPIYIANMGMVRGYYSPFYNVDVAEQNGIYFEQMLGSKLFLGSFEIRLPFTGLERLSLIKSRYFFSDIALFFDAGVAFDEFEHFSEGELIVTGYDQNEVPITEYLKPAFVMSTGVALRINLMGALIIEPYYAWPIQKESQPVFGINFIPGF